MLLCIPQIPVRAGLQQLRHMYCELARLDMGKWPKMSWATQHGPVAMTALQHFIMLVVSSTCVWLLKTYDPCVCDHHQPDMVTSQSSASTLMMGLL